jgi:hypothetical protein
MAKTINAEAFEAFIRKAFKLTDEEVAGLYNDAGELTDFSLIERKDADRVTKLASDKTNQYNRGLKEGAEKLEKILREKYEVESDLIGEELFDFIIEAKLEGAKTSSEDIMKHPDVVKLINRHGKEIKDLKKTHADELKAKDDAINYSAFMADINSLALKEFHGLNPILSEDPVKAKNQESLFLEKVAKVKYRKDGDVPIVLKSDGTNMTDEHGHPVSFQDFVKATAETIFDFKVAEGRSSPGNGDSDRGKGTQSKKVRTPKNMDDYISMMQDNSLTAKERIEIKNLALQAKII